jgi:ABC-type multidrug transport system ATPase subunit
VAVIHQPRAEIFALIDDMIILVRGGKMAYQGPAQYVIEYFALHGCVAASGKKVNKTDFLIDVTSVPPIGARDNIHSVDSRSYASGQSGTLNALHGLQGEEEGEEGALWSGDSERDEESESLASSGQVTWPDLWERDGVVSALDCRDGTLQ